MSRMHACTSVYQILAQPLLTLGAVKIISIIGLDTFWKADESPLPIRHFNDMVRMELLRRKYSSIWVLPIPH